MTAEQSIDKPTVIIVMGVSGAGKTTIGKLLAAQLNWSFKDADDFHSPANKAKMHKGIALSDEDRQPWLDSMAQSISAWAAGGPKTVLACSALKESYRALLCGGNEDVAIVYLRAGYEAIAGRLEKRTDHFMNKDLLQSQFATLEEPGKKFDKTHNDETSQTDEVEEPHRNGGETNEALVVDATKPPAAIVKAVRRAFAL